MSELPALACQKCGSQHVVAGRTVEDAPVMVCDVQICGFIQKLSHEEVTRRWPPAFPLYLKA